jgi:hypothetical protein
MTRQELIEALRRASKSDELDILTRYRALTFSQREAVEAVMNLCRQAAEALEQEDTARQLEARTLNAFIASDRAKWGE